MAGLFSSKAPPSDSAEDDYSDDAAPVDEESEDVGAEPLDGPFESACKTIFDEKASYDEKCDALREAIMTLLDEMGGSGGPPTPPGALGGL